MCIALLYWFQRAARRGKPVVIIDHHFAQDIDSLLRQAGVVGINLIRIPYKYIFQVAEFYFPPEIRDGSYNAPGMKECKTRYRALLVKFFSRTKPETKIASLLMPSDSFFWIREIVALLKERKIPCIVIDKEGTISPFSMDHHSRQIASYYPFMSDAIIVWSDRQKEFWTRAGVDERRIFVDGQPRSDFFFDTGRWLSRKKLPIENDHYVLFFTFETDAYAPTPGENIWQPLRADIHGSIARFAKKYPQITFIVKTHPQQADALDVEQEFRVYGLRNIIVMHGPEVSRHLIVHADIVIGFQTTALIEAMLLPKTVIYTQWTETVSRNIDKLIPFHTALGIDIANSLEEFETLLDGMLSSGNFSCMPKAHELRKAFTDTYFYHADGQTSLRVLSRVLALIKQYTERREYADSNRD